ncbi:hypothetical protein ATANTOWER_016210, partial [Ataeniobius toweri]|nr:hypothetical protein [Ataeniobius toweri]
YHSSQPNSILITCTHTETHIQENRYTHTHTKSENIRRVSREKQINPLACSSALSFSLLCIPDMTLFSPRYMSMSGELKSSRSRAASKRASNTTYGPLSETLPHLSFPINASFSLLASCLLCV